MLRSRKKATNMAAENDIDALKIYKKSRTNEAEKRQKIKNSLSQLKIYRFKKKKSVLRLVENFET